MSSQNNNYCTFENLSKLCDTWIMDTEMWEGVFKNQSSEINRFFDLIGNNHKKVRLQYNVNFQYILYIFS